MFKGLFRFVFGLIKLLLLIALLAVIFHTWVIRQAVTFSLSYQLGADVSVRSVKMDWKNTGFEVQGLEIGNPYSFPKGMLADIPLVIVSVDLPSIPRGVLRLKTLGFNLRELQVMNVARKGLNLLALKPLQKDDEDHSGSSSPEPVRRQTWKHLPEIVIDELIFSIGEISYLDMSGPSLKQNRFKAGIRGATYYNIRGTQDVTAIVVGEALKKTGLGYLQTQFQHIRDRYGFSGNKKSGFFGSLMETFGAGSSHG